MTEKWMRREKKLNKKKYGMRVSGKSLFTIENIQKKRTEEIKNARKNKENKNFLTE